MQSLMSVRSESHREGAASEKVLSPPVWCFVLSFLERRLASEEGGYRKRCDGGGGL